LSNPPAPAYPNQKPTAIYQKVIKIEAQRVLIKTRIVPRTKRIIRKIK
jgi:hypothetical protein